MSRTPDPSPPAAISEANALADTHPAGQWWLVGLLFAGTFINAIDRASLSTAAPELMNELRLDPAVMGVALSAFFWCYLLGNVPAGALADRFGAKLTLGWAAAFWSICSAATGLATRSWQVILARMGVGIGEAATFPVNAKVVCRNFSPAARGTVVGIYSSGLRLGFAVTPPLMAWLMSTWGWRAAFYATGLGSLAWVALWCFCYHENAKIHAPLSLPLNGLRTFRPQWRLLNERTVLGLVLCKFFQDYLFYLFVTWLPGYLVLGRGFSVMKMGWYASLPWVAGFLAQLLAGSVSDWLIRRGSSVTLARKSIVISMQLLAGSVVLAGYTANPVAAVWLLTLSMACESASTSLLWTTCTDVAPPALAGSLAGLMNSAGALAGILAPTVTGLLVKFTGSFQEALLIGSGMVILAALSMWLLVGEVKPLIWKARDAIGSPDLKS
jgi:ACS family glucarate transporter-like MFS transporter